MSTPTSAPSPKEKPANSVIKEEVASSPPPESPPSPPATSPPPESTPPPSPPAATPSPPNSPPPAPPTSSPPPPSSTPPSSPPPSTPASSPPPATPAAESQSPPPPASSASPPPPNETPPSPTSVTPSTPTPANAAPSQNSPPTAAALAPPVSSYPPPKAISSGTPDPPSTFSPNPPRPSSSSSSSDRSTNDSPPKQSSSNDHPSLDVGVIAGIIFGGLIIIILLAVIICLICSKKKRKPQYYMDPGRPPNGMCVCVCVCVYSGSQYYNQDPGAQWHSGPQQMDQNHKMHPPAGSFMGSSIGGGWAGSNNNNSGEFMSSSGQHPMGGIGQFSYEDLAAATGGFSQANLLGQGGFGLVHKGILPDGREVAVKSLKSGSGQGEREFQAEVEIISRVHHRHLVSLVGYCIANQNKLLVYEYVPNKTLEFHLHGKGQPVMDWPTRLRIAIGTAKGLAYLHEDCLPRIIHRDIKTANILIDNNFEAMVADFGLAKLTTENHTHVSTRVMGTFGYLAPEYASSGKLSEKSDVFSFGVMLLELVTGRQPIDLTGTMMEDSLVDWARPLLSTALEDGNFEQLVDPRLEGKFLHHELAHMAACAAASIRHSARKRPKMSQIVRALEGDSSLDDLNEGVKPGQSGLYNPNGGTQMYDTRAYNADMLKFKKMVMTSEEFNSSEYGTTSEYGLNPSLSVSSDADSTDIMENRSSQIQKT
ncbi:Protein kinase superfamily protein [Perilla frutescens var. frutescens]|nr:Protein kinase superfamily protein [Perilla frutescens var. frutescens]